MMKKLVNGDHERRCKRIKYGFKKGGLVKQGKPKLAKKGWR
jgi:hypothetical protein